MRRQLIPHRAWRPHLQRGASQLGARGRRCGELHAGRFVSGRVPGVCARRGRPAGQREGGRMLLSGAPGKLGTLLSPVGAARPSGERGPRMRDGSVVGERRPGRNGRRLVAEIQGQKVNAVLIDGVLFHKAAPAVERAR